MTGTVAKEVQHAVLVDSAREMNLVDCTETRGGMRFVQQQVQPRQDAQQPLNHQAPSYVQYLQYPHQQYAQQPGTVAKEDMFYQPQPPAIDHAPEVAFFRSAPDEARKTNSSSIGMIVGWGR
jgi:hypothetical protein